MAETVKDVFGEIPAMAFEWNPNEIPDLSQIWADYDADSDSFILYTTGKPRGGVHVYIDDDVYAIVDRKTRKVIGFYVENWQRSFVPAHKEVREAWAGIKPTPVDTWVMLLRMLALWLLLSLSENAKHRPNMLQPV